MFCLLALLIEHTRLPHCVAWASQLAFIIEQLHHCFMTMFILGIQISSYIARPNWSLDKLIIRHPLCLCSTPIASDALNWVLLTSWDFPLNMLLFISAKKISEKADTALAETAWNNKLYEDSMVQIYVLIWRISRYCVLSLFCGSLRLNGSMLSHFFQFLSFFALMSTAMLFIFNFNSIL